MLRKNNGEMNPIDMILDDNNADNVVLWNENNEPIEFEQVAVIPIKNQTYVLLAPASPMPGVADDEAVVFMIEEIQGEESLVVVEDMRMVDRVFDEYYKMLAEAYE